MNKDKLAFVEYDGMIDFLAKLRNNTKRANQKYIPDEVKKMSKKRPIVETVIGLQKGVLDLGHTRHRSALNAFTHMLAAMCAYSFYQRKSKVSIQTHRALKQYNRLIAA